MFYMMIVHITNMKNILIEITTEKRFQRLKKIFTYKSIVSHNNKGENVFFSTIQRTIFLTITFSFEYKRGKKSK